MGRPAIKHSDVSPEPGVGLWKGEALGWGLLKEKEQRGKRLRYIYNRYVRRQNNLSEIESNGICRKKKSMLIYRIIIKLISENVSGKLWLV